MKGAAVRACVVLREGRTATAEELIGLCRERIAAYKVPAIVEFVGTLPKSPTGKILKKELRGAGRPAGGLSGKPPPMIWCIMTASRSHRK